MLIIKRSKLHYTASGIITLIGGRLVHRLREGRFCASSWLITEINILRCTVRKTSTFVITKSCYSDIYDLIFITQFLKSNIN